MRAGPATGTFGAASTSAADPFDETILLPERLYGTLGKTMDLYHDNALRVADGDLGDYTFTWGARYGTGTSDAEKFSYAPTHDGNLIHLSATDGVDRWTSSSRIYCARPNAPITQNLKLLVIGDSITYLGWYLDRLASNMRKDGWSLLGSQATSAGTPHEGIVGFTYAAFNTHVDSPLVHSGALNVAHYISAHIGGVTPDVVFFCLGPNDLGSADPDAPDTAITTMLAAQDVLLAAWAAAAPSARLFVSSLQVQNGWAAGYTDSGFTRDEWKRVQSRAVQRQRTKFTGTHTLCPLHPSIDPLLGYDAAPAPAVMSHPNAVGHAQMAAQLEAFLRYQFRV